MQEQSKTKKERDASAATPEAAEQPNGEKHKGAPQEDTSGRLTDILYTIEEVPPWGLCLLLGFQHYLTAFGGIVSVPLILYRSFCIAEDRVGLSEVISTIFFCSGLITLLQTTLGVRLPIIQGGSFTFLIPTFALMNLPKWPSCPYTDAEQGLRNLTDLPAYGSPEHRELWHDRIREVQGAIMVASLFQIVIGFTGLMGVVLRFIGPLAVTPTVALIGLGLFPEAAHLASKQWYIALTTIVLIGLFSQYLRNISVPMCRISRETGCGLYKLPIFKLFPVLMAMMLAWLICGILTAAGAFPERGGWGYEARTDIKLDVLKDSSWFRFPYPGQWGVPTVSSAGVFGMLAGIISSMIESVGDYIACARLSGAPPPPDHAVNRGIGIEGLGCLLAGAWGSGSGTTSYSENIGAIGITKVGSRRVVQVGAVIMLVLGCFGKFGALFVTIPDPVIGGMFIVMFGMVCAVGLSNLQFVDLSSARNIFVLGTSIFFGLTFPVWVKDHSDSINTGNEVVDQILAVLFGTNMFVGGIIGLVLDNTIPGTEEERGIKRWREITSVSGSTRRSAAYDLPLIQRFLDRMSWPRYVPLCPAFDGCRRRHSDAGENYYNQAFDAGASPEETQL